MAELKARRPTCQGRPCYLQCTGELPQKVKGKTLIPGKRYCAGDKRIRTFRSGDPKVHVPSWCPLQKTPPVLRIYCIKNSLAWMMREMFRRDGKNFPPSDTDYAMRYEGVSPLTAVQFQKGLSETDAQELLKVEVHRDEVIEIDDGLTPYCFHLPIDGGRPKLIYFKGERARENPLEEPDNDEGWPQTDPPAGDCL